MSERKDEILVPENSIMVGLALVEDDQLAIVRLEHLSDNITPEQEDIIQSVTLGVLFLMRHGLGALKKIGEQDMALDALLRDSDFDETVVPFDTTKH
jgi:hypothetical protein